ncbi:zinc finger, CCHC-type containing protein [Tanacetum coccineum]
MVSDRRGAKSFPLGTSMVFRQADEAVSNGSIKKVEKRGNVGEPSKDKNGRDDNKRTRTGNAFASTANHVGRENTGTWPKCTTCNSYHAPEGPRRTCFNCNRPGHLAKDYRGVQRNMNPVNARNPTVRACYECGSTDHVRSACPRLNRAQGPEENRPNQVATNNGSIEPIEFGFRYEIEIASGQLVEIDKAGHFPDVVAKLFFGSSNLTADPNAVSMIQTASHLSPNAVGDIQTASSEPGIWVLESGEYKKTFTSSGVGTGSMQVLYGFEFKVETLWDHTFEVEPQENVDQGAGLQEVQTQNLMDYQLARDREQHLACELFGYREDSNEAAFAVAAVDKIYAHESLTFIYTIACEVISTKSNDDSHDYYWEYAPVGSQEYQVVCTRPDIASVGVDMLDRFDRGLHANHIEALSITEAGYMTKERWLKGLLTESGYELRLVAGIFTGALVKGGPRSEVPAHIEVAAYRH